MPSRRRIDSSAIIVHPLNFDIQLESSLKYDAKNSTCIHISMAITLSVFDIDFLYQFNLRLHHFSQFIFNVKKIFSKVGRSVIVVEMANHVGVHRSKAAEGCSVFQRRCYSFCFILILQEMTSILCSLSSSAIL